jgi:hypothetical protein
MYRESFSRPKLGGFFVVNDFFPDDDRTGPTFPLRFSVYTLTNTPGGECWTLSKYTAWLKKAGFASIASLSTKIPSAFSLLN